MKDSGGGWAGDRARTRCRCGCYIAGDALIGYLVGDFAATAGLPAPLHLTVYIDPLQASKEGVTILARPETAPRALTRLVWRQNCVRARTLTATNIVAAADPVKKSRAAVRPAPGRLFPGRSIARIVSRESPSSSLEDGEQVLYLLRDSSSLIGRVDHVGPIQIRILVAAPDHRQIFLQSRALIYPRPILGAHALRDLGQVRSEEDVYPCSPDDIPVPLISNSATSEGDHRAIHGTESLAEAILSFPEAQPTLVRDHLSKTLAGLLLHSGIEVLEAPSKVACQRTPQRRFSGTDQAG